MNIRTRISNFAGIFILKYFWRIAGRNVIMIAASEKNSTMTLPVIRALMNIRMRTSLIEFIIIVWTPWVFVLMLFGRILS